METRRALRLYASVAANINDCSFNDIARLLKALGFVETSRGSHHGFRRPGSTPLSIPKRKPVKVVYVKQVLAAADAILKGEGK